MRVLGDALFLLSRPAGGTGIFPAINCIDGDFATWVATPKAEGSWLAVELEPEAARVGYVAVYNSQPWSSMLQTFEVWLSTTPGNLTAAADAVLPQASHVA